MFNKIMVMVGGVSSPDDKNRIETEIDVLDGVKNIGINQATGELRVEFDDAKISREEILNKIEGGGWGGGGPARGGGGEKKKPIFFFKGGPPPPRGVFKKKKFRG